MSLLVTCGQLEREVYPFCDIDVAITVLPPLLLATYVCISAHLCLPFFVSFFIGWSVSELRKTPNNSVTSAPWFSRLAAPFVRSKRWGEYLESQQGAGRVEVCWHTSRQGSCRRVSSPCDTPENSDLKQACL